MSDKGAIGLSRTGAWGRLGFGVIVMCLLSGGVGFSHAGGFSFKEEPGKRVDVRYDGKPVARYVYVFDDSTDERRHETYKPFCHIIDPTRSEPITKGPGGRYSHHRGIFIGWSKLTTGGESYDFWHMSGGSQIHRDFLKKKSGEDKAVLRAQIDWVRQSGETVIEEVRTYKFRAIDSPGIVEVDFTSKLEAVGGDVALRGDPEHAGIQYRPANDIQNDKTEYLFPFEGVDPHEDKDLEWAAENYWVDGYQYSVTHMNHPSNPKGTLYSAYRPYGRFGAFFEKTVPEGETLKVKYRLLIRKGEMLEREKIENLWEAFADK